MNTERALSAVLISLGVIFLIESAGVLYVFALVPTVAVQGDVALLVIVGQMYAVLKILVGIFTIAVGGMGLWRSKTPAPAHS